MELKNGGVMKIQKKLREGMQKYFLIMFLLGFALILICGIAGCNKTEPVSSSNEPSNEDKALLNNAINVADCEKIVDIWTKDACYNNIGGKSNDLSICNKISGPNSMKNGCYIGVASKTSNLSICEMLIEDYNKNNCYSNIAINTKDASICEKISDVSKKESCKLSISGGETASDCDKILDYILKDNCYMKMANISKDISLCDKMRSATVNCYWMLADDPAFNCDFCIQIEDIESRNSCYRSCAESHKDAAVCDKIIEDGEDTTAEQARNYCYTDVVKITKDCSICDKTTDNYKKYCSMEC